jgi:hypothetical protein
MTNEEYEATVREAESRLNEAKTKEEVSMVWKEFYLSLGHKALGRMLVGKTADDLIKQKVAAQ